MTYAVYLLYCKDKYAEKDFQDAYTATAQVMAARGFPKMRVFTDKLLEVHAEHPELKIEYLYPALLKSFDQTVR